MAKRFKAPVRVNIGRARIPYSDTSTQAEFERNVRKQTAALMKNFAAWVDHMDDESANVLKEAMEPTFDKSQVYVPKDTRALARSGYLEARKFRGRSVVEIGYGKGGSPPYAAIVHENLEFFHAEPTQAKFLERALLEDEAAIQQRLAKGFEETSGV